jgi:NAD(P)-dependent dehydrogenase (short-subunit alcohol dehydrogenase family)
MATGRLKGKAAIVTGAGTGIGRGIALAFAGEGAKVLVIGRRQGKLDETVALITGAGGVAEACSGDVAKATDVERMVQACQAKFGPVDILVNNAGVRIPFGILKVSEAQLETMLAVNVKGVYLSSRAVVPGMLARKWGRIINIASVAGIRTSINAGYCASKAAVVALTKSMALEFSPHGVTVNAICPGVIVSELSEPELQNPTDHAYLLSRTLAGYIGEPSDVAAGAVYLASEEARFVTGAVVAIDGGWTLT